MRPDNLVGWKPSWARNFLLCSWDVKRPYTLGYKMVRLRDGVEMNFATKADDMLEERAMERDDPVPSGWTGLVFLRFQE
jgi:hypothetical protein